METRIVKTDEGCYRVSVREGKRRRSMVCVSRPTSEVVRRIEQMLGGAFAASGAEGRKPGH